MKTVRQIGSLAFVAGLFTAIFAGIPWYVVVADDPVVPWWLRIADFCLPILSPLDDSSTPVRDGLRHWQIDRPPRVMHTYLGAYARRIYDHAFRTAIGL